MRLHYRAVNQLAAFRTLEAPPSPRTTFIIPGYDMSADTDLMYYFEVLHGRNGGWFQPDPDQATPYHVVAVRGEKARTRRHSRPLTCSYLTYLLHLEYSPPKF